MSLPQGPIADIDYFTLLLEQTGQWPLATSLLDSGTGMTFWVMVVRELLVSGLCPRTGVESVSDDLGATGTTDGNARLYVPQFRDDWRRANSTAMNLLSPLGRADFDPNTHYLLRSLLDRW